VADFSNIHIGYFKHLARTQKMNDHWLTSYLSEQPAYFLMLAGDALIVYVLPAHRWHSWTHQFHIVVTVYRCLNGLAPTLIYNRLLLCIKQYVLSENLLADKGKYLLQSQKDHLLLLLLIIGSFLFPRCVIINVVCSPLWHGTTINFCYLRT